jgi:2-dehydro-3-deoxygluconokinase
MALSIRAKASCRFDLVALGEVMLRLDPGDQRVATTRQFRVWEGGGEYNVARGLKRCFGLDTAIATALVDNPVGRLVQDLIYQGGVDQSYLRWVADDGVGRSARNGLNFTERGFGVRAPVGCSDRGHTAVGQLAPGAIDWDRLFGVDGARWFHTGGIFAALSESTAAVADEAMAAARRHGVVVSYDLNYRPSLWKSIGGKARAQEVNRALARRVDVMLGNEEDFTVALGFAVEGVGDGYARLDAAAYQAMFEAVRREYPQLAMIATTLRVARSASSNDWGAVGYCDGALVQARTRPDLAIYDRIGGGDSFASGLIYGLLAGRGAAWAIECGAAHGALAMTTPGDTTMATLTEVEKVMAGAAARVER